MNFPVPDYVTVPSTEIMQTISVVSLVVGICLVGVGLFFLFLNKRKGKGQKNTFIWVLTVIGILLIVNHSIQLLF